MFNTYIYEDKNVFHQFCTRVIIKVMKNKTFVLNLKILYFFNNHIVLSSTAAEKKLKINKKE